MTRGTIQVIAGGQYGSEAKGAVAGYLAAEQEQMLAIRVAGPNAGHSVVDPITGEKYALRQIPAAAVTNPGASLCIAAGSEIDPYVLHEEIAWLERGGIHVKDRLLIDPAATWLTQDHKDREITAGIVGRIGSTGKGIGAARAARIMREARTVGQHRSEFEQYGHIGSVATAARSVLRGGATVQIEGTQGYGLGLHGEHYPQCTSSDCTALDFLQMARVNPWEADQLQVWLVFRPYPIRVAGNSGYLYGETSWEALGLAPEMTTVTKNIRRVGQWDGGLAYAAMQANGGSRVVWPVLTMADQIDPALAGVTDSDTVLGSDLLGQFLKIFEADVGLEPCMITTSDRTCVRL
jgi:adenylosuccinate synthase